MLSSGDEIGQVNGYGYHDDPVLREDSRNLHRTPFDWDVLSPLRLIRTVGTDIGRPFLCSLYVACGRAMHAPTGCFRQS